MKRYRFVLLPLAACLIIVVTTIVFASPKLKTIAEIKQRLPEEKEKLSRLTKKAAQLESLDERELEKKVTMSEKALPSKKTVSGILSVFSSLAEETDVFFVDFEVSPGKFLPGEFEVVLFEATFKGPREEVKTLLEKMRQVLPVVKVVGFEIKGEEATLSVESYFSPLPESLGKIDTPLPEISQKEEKIYQKIAQFKIIEKELPSVPGGKENPFSEF